MSDWTNSHDLVYAFVCVSFLADGDVDESEKEAMRGNVKVMPVSYTHLTLPTNC